METESLRVSPKKHFMGLLYGLDGHGLGEESTKEKVEKVEDEVARDGSGDLEEFEDSGGGTSGDEESGEEKEGEMKEKEGWKRQEKRGEKGKVKRQKQCCRHIGENSMSHPHSPSGE